MDKRAVSRYILIADVILLILIYLYIRDYTSRPEHYLPRPVSFGYRGARFLLSFQYMATEKATSMLLTYDAEQAIATSLQIILRCGNRKLWDRTWKPSSSSESGRLPVVAFFPETRTTHFFQSCPEYIHFPSRKYLFSFERPTLPLNVEIRINGETAFETLWKIEKSDQAR